MTSVVGPQIQQCPINGNSFMYNNTLCACNPGYLYNATARSCSLFRVDVKDWMRLDSGIDYSINFPNIFSFDTITRFTQSQAVFLEATLVMLLSWLFFCFFARFGSLGDGRTVWFKIRWWISRLDICFATRHWLVINHFFFLVDLFFDSVFPPIMVVLWLSCMKIATLKYMANHYIISYH